MELQPAQGSAPFGRRPAASARLADRSKYNTLLFEYPVLCGSASPSLVSRLTSRPRRVMLFLIHNRLMSEFRLPQIAPSAECTSHFHAAADYLYDREPRQHVRRGRRDDLADQDACR